VKWRRVVWYNIIKAYKENADAILPFRIRKVFGRREHQKKIHCRILQHNFSRSSITEGRTSPFVAAIVSYVQFRRKRFPKLSTVVSADLSSLQMYAGLSSYITHPSLFFCWDLKSVWRGSMGLTTSFLLRYVIYCGKFISRRKPNFVAVSLNYKPAYRLTPVVGWKCVATCIISTCIILSCDFSISCGGCTEHASKK